MSKIVGFAGRKRSGKDMLAKSIKEVNPNTVIIAVADNLKILCANLLNVSVEELNKMKDNGTTFKERVDAYWITEINKSTGISEDNILEEIGGLTFHSVREMLQVIGTDLIRKFVPEWHIDKTIERIQSIEDDKLVIVDDVRFPNEKSKLEEIGGTVYFVIRPNNFDVSNHTSETALKYTDFCDDKVIINDLPKETMGVEFTKMYFEGYKTEILLSNNPWYIEHMIDMCTNEPTVVHDRKVIINLVIKENKEKPLFVNNGIITFKSDNPYLRSLFRQIIMNDKRTTDGCSAYSVYNPLTNEVLKTFM